MNRQVNPSEKPPSVEPRERTIPMPTPMTAWQTLCTGNEITAWRSRSVAAAVKPPIALVFRCADAGPSSDVIFGQDCASIIDVSTWGHVVDVGVLATVDHAVDGLQVPLVVVLGHQGCSAMLTALRVWNDGQDMPETATRAAVEQATTSILHRASGAVSADRLEAAHVVEAGLSLMGRSPALAEAVDNGQCAVVCAVTDETSGRRVRVCATFGDVNDECEDLLECI